METLLKQIKNTNELNKSEEKRKEFNDRMVHLTWKYQKIYNFEVSNRKEHEFWNNEADAFKHTFGSALMVFELGHLGSVAGGIHHEYIQPNNPENEWNMDSWNNREGRKIAKEIKEEYGEKNFRKLSKEEQENIIAHKTMVRMKNGDLITHPDDKRVYSGKTENIVKGIKSGILNVKQNINFDNMIHNGKRWINWSDEDHKTFLEGLETGEFTKEGEKRVKAQGKNWTNKFNVGNVETDDGHWVTMPNGKHLFIKDK